MANFGVFGVATIALLWIAVGNNAVPIYGAKLQLSPDTLESSISPSPSISYKTEESVAPPCTASTSVEALSKKEFEEDLLAVFFELSNRSGILQEQAVDYFASEMNVPNECATIDTGVNPPPSIYPLTERTALNQLVEYYFNLTRFAMATGDALIWEEQRAVRLQPSFYKELSDIKGLLYQGTVNIKKVLAKEGYECASDPFPSVNVVLETQVCPRRYIAMVTIMGQLNTETSQALSLLYQHHESMQ